MKKVRLPVGGITLLRGAEDIVVHPKDCFILPVFVFSNPKVLINGHRLRQLLYRDKRIIPCGWKLLSELKTDKRFEHRLVHAFGDIFEKRGKVGKACILSLNDVYADRPWQKTLLDRTFLSSEFILCARRSEHLISFGEDDEEIDYGGHSSKNESLAIIED